jgi:hypothetical protein
MSAVPPGGKDAFQAFPVNVTRLPETAGVEFQDWASRACPNSTVADQLRVAFPVLRALMLAQYPLPQEDVTVSTPVRSPLTSSAS